MHVYDNCHYVSFAQLCNFKAKMTMFEMSLLWAGVRGKGRGRVRLGLGQIMSSLH